ncbi:ABC transporter substrate-binding protein [Helicobacter sp. MIT 00-7814]|uniref:cysteine ABC transporter substrate-binding protein n=1 Tax=unclassified Helicobacter TaxID=2593540 RepID=UPI000E1F73E2|nr:MULTISPECIES: cysteine ABC transporter substrate-binding protein [unclassified Helicobacter]RDU54215.1 ABC transporter substrate-binding protein [Helicobacter sp. MIT 00-7814]RDU56039.1 ABC transporter substrate-binding protein [Helicobacter sp. MIT 99-10781]
MKKLFKFTLGVVFAFAVGAIFSACGEDSKKQEVSALERIKQRQEVFIGVFGDKPPFGYIDSQGENAGFDVVLAKRIAKDLLGDEKKAKFIVVEAANRVEFLRSNKVDIIMANFTKTPEREKVVDFAKPYMKVSLGVVSKDGAISDVKELEGKTLIVNKGTTADFYFSKNFPELKILKFEQNTEAFAALKDGRGDALAHDNTLLFAWAKENPSFKVGIKELGENDVIAPAVKKDNKELLEWLDSEISALIEEGFLLQAYESTLAPAYSDEIHASDVVF